MNEDYLLSKYNETGKANAQAKDHRLITYKIGIYDIKIELGDNDRFIGISEIKVNKQFMNILEMISSTGHIDIVDYEEEEEEEE